MPGLGSSRVAHPLAASAGALLALALAGSAACASSGGNKGDGPPADPTISSFAAVPASVEPGGATSLVATFANGTGEIDGGIGGVSSGVPASTDPHEATTTFTLTVRNTAGV